MKAIRFESPDGKGIFRTLHPHIVETHGANYPEVVAFNDTLPTTNGYGPCWFTPTGFEVFIDKISALLDLCDELGEEIIWREEEFNRYHRHDAYQIIPCLHHCIICVAIEAGVTYTTEKLRLTVE